MCRRRRRRSRLLHVRRWLLLVMQRDYPGDCVRNCNGRFITHNLSNELGCLNWSIM